MTNKDLTVIITTFKSENKIDECLNSIDKNIKVIVVENSNNKKFKSYLEGKFKNVECLLTNDNLGYGKANNIGLRKVKTKYSLVLNPDAILGKDALNIFFTHVKKKINFAIMGPTQKKEESNIINQNNKTNLIEVNEIKGFAMFLNMEKFTSIGFFDENIFLYLEEIDLCKRVKNQDEKIYFDPSIKIKHLGGKSVDKIFSDQIEQTRNWHWMWSKIYFNKKYYGFFTSTISALSELTKSLAKCIFYLFTLNKKKTLIYYFRISGIVNSLIGKKSWYRPNISKPDETF